MMCTMPYLVMSHHLCQHLYHVLDTASSMAQIHSLCPDDQNEVQYDFLVTWYHWCQDWCNRMLRASSMSPMHSLGQGNQMRCNITFMWFNQHWCWHQLMLMVSLMASLHSLGSMIKMMCSMTFLVKWCHWNLIHMPLMSKMVLTYVLVSSCTHVRQLFQYICLISTQCNQKNDQDHWYKYISHYWHMPPKTYMPPTSHKYDPWHYCCIYKSKCPSNVIYMPSAQLTWCPAVGEVCQSESL